MALRHPICAGSSPTTRHTGAVGARPRPTSLPGDDAVLMGRTVAAAAATVGLGLALTGSVLRLRGLPDVFSVPPTLLAQAGRADAVAVCGPVRAGLWAPRWVQA